MRGEVGAQPLFLTRAHAVVDHTIDCYDVPSAEVVAVVTLSRITCRRPEVGEVGIGPRCMVVMATRSRPSASPMASPTWGITPSVIVSRSILIGVVSGGEDPARAGIEDSGRCFVLARPANCAIAGAHKDRRRHPPAPARPHTP